MQLVAQRLQEASQPAACEFSLASSASPSQPRAASDRVDPVQLWVSELRWYAESDCANVLHSKALPAAQTAAAAASAAAAADRRTPSAKVSIELLDVKSRQLAGEFKRVFHCIRKRKPQQLPRVVQQLTGCLRQLAATMRALVIDETDEMICLEKHLLHLCQQLDSAISDPSHGVTSVQSDSLACLTSAVADSSLTWLRHGAQLLTSRLAEEATADGGRGLRDLLALAGKGENFCCLLAQSSAVERLLQFVSSSSNARRWPLALRALCAICCNEEALARFDRADGLSCVTSVLSNHRNSELVRAEAAGVVAQVTGPVNVKAREQAVNVNADELIRSLTILCQEASSHDVFLLSAAAVANISFVCPGSFRSLVRHNTARVLINACQLSKADSLFAKDQVATVLANVSANPVSHSELTRVNAAELLLQLLHESAACHAGAAARAACERVQQKAAIALGRLGRQADSARVLAELGAHRRLAELCRRPEERNNSQAVLLAALAAVRQMADTLGARRFARMRDLLTPTIADAFNRCAQVDETCA